MSITILIVDDQPVVRAGLAALFDKSGIEISGEAGSARDAIAKTKKLKPDVVLLDVRIDDEMDGFACLRRIREKWPAMPVVMFSAFDNPTYIARSVALGATDYVLKSSSRHDLNAAIKAAANGKAPTRASALQRISEIMNANDVPDDVPLTKREMQVARHIAFGLSNKEIAASLHISVETVKEHVQNILRKLDFVDRTQVGVWAVRSNLV